MSDKKELEIIVVHENITESVVSDTYTFAGLIFCTLVGYWLDSSAIQWISCSFLALMIVVRSIKNSFIGGRLTVAEARKKLDELEAKFAK